MLATCQVCGARDWLDLPDPVEGRTVTTAGRIVDEGLGKSHCAACGFVQRIHGRFLGHTEYYERDYATYYDRPGTARFHAERYRVLAEWMVSVLGPASPPRVVDVGCGQGWTMEALRSFYPTAVIEGIEPSIDNARVARTKGFVVHQTRVGHAGLGATHDLAYCNNVLQHVTNATEFVAALKAMVRDGGRVVITCPDGSVPNIELLWGDQNFSFLPIHVVRLCRQAGFEAVRWFPSPPSPAVPPAQMVVLSTTRHGAEDGDGGDVPQPSPRDVFEAKRRYLESFRAIDDHLCARTQDHACVFNFGASYWSSILAAYCPRYWARVAACVVTTEDHDERDFLGKKVLRLSAVAPRDAVLVAGTSPSTHDAVGRMVSSDWPVITWNHFPVQY